MCAFIRGVIAGLYDDALADDMLILYGSKTYTIEYLNNVDEANVELEIQAKEITH